MTSEERRKNYVLGITPGEWMQALGIVGVLLAGGFAYAGKIERNSERIEGLEVQLEKTKNDLVSEIRRSEARQNTLMKDSEERIRTDMQEIRSIIKEIYRIEHLNGRHRND